MNIQSSFLRLTTAVVVFGLLTFLLLVGLGKAAMGEVLSYNLITSGTTNFTSSFDQSDAMGVSVANLGDLDGDGVNDIAVGSKGDDDDSGINTGTGKGAVYIIFLNSDSSVKSYQKISDTEGGLTAGVLQPNWKFGASIEAIGDFNGDEVVDIAVGANGMNSSAGGIFLIYLNTDGTVAGYAQPTVSGLDASDQFGDGGIANLGDLDDDGVIDLAVGAYYDDDTSGVTTNHGAVHILFMNANGTVKSQAKISDTTTEFYGVLEGTGAGSDLCGVAVEAIPDQDSDGNSELMMGCYYDDDLYANAGAVYFFFLDDDGTIKSYNKLSGADAVLSTAVDAVGDAFGNGLAYLGDMDSDGNFEVAIGAPGYRVGGAVHVVSIDSSGEPQAVVTLAAEQGGMPDITAAEGGFGTGLSAIGDIDGDGAVDMAAGLTGKDNGATLNVGGVYILNLEGGAAASTSSTTAQRIPKINRVFVADEMACAQSPSVILGIEGSDISQVYAANNENFFGAVAFPFLPGNASSFPSITGGQQSTFYFEFPLNETGDTPIYIAVRSSTGGLTGPATIVMDSPSECEDDQTLETPESIPEISVDYEAGDIIVSTEGGSHYFISEQGEKRIFPTPHILETWMPIDGSALQISPEVIRMIPSGEPMLPKGPTLISFEGVNETIYISSAQVPRLVETPGLEQDLFGSQWRTHIDIVPSYLRNMVSYGRPLVRFELPVLREWKNYLQNQ